LVEISGTISKIYVCNCRTTLVMRLDRRSVILIEHLIKTQHFEGPLDLLIDLIKRKEMDVYNLQVSEITADYLHAVKEMGELHIEVMSEFMEMASLLVQIKCKMLMPELNELADAEDPRKVLIQEILDYQARKERTDKLQELKEIENKVYRREKLDVVQKKKVGTLQDIIAIYQSLFQRKFKKGNSLDHLTNAIAKYKFTIEDRITHLSEILQSAEKVDVHMLFDDIEDREQMVVTFSALLELVKMQRILLHGDGSEIQLQWRGDKIE
jgi:segregation and condensation protein A